MIQLETKKKEILKQKENEKIQIENTNKEEMEKIKNKFKIGRNGQYT
jgi:hypothetical protein